MNGTPASVGALPWPDRRVPPISTGDLDSLALLRFETMDALTLAEAVLAGTRALEDWVRALPRRYAAAPFAAPVLEAQVGAVGETGLSTEAVELLLLALDELHGYLEEPRLQVAKGAWP